MKSKKKEKSIIELVKWYQKVHCYRKCYNNFFQRKICKTKFESLIQKNTALSMTRKDFLNFFNNHMTICVLPQKEKEQYITWKEFKTRTLQQK